MSYCHSHFEFVSTTDRFSLTGAKHNNTDRGLAGFLKNIFLEGECGGGREKGHPAFTCQVKAGADTATVSPAGFSSSLVFTSFIRGASTFHLSIHLFLLANVTLEIMSTRPAK